GHNIELKLWNDPAATAAANLLCDTMSQALKTDSTGHFSLTLGDDCTKGIGANKDTYVDVLLDGTSLATTRTKLGAVPYAVEANHALSADSASGALATQISQIQALTHAQSAFRADLSTANTTIADHANTKIVFDKVEFDLANEYNSTTGVFTPKQAGIYVINCGVEFDVNIVGDWNANIIKTPSGGTGTPLAGTDVEGNAFNGFSTTVSVVAQLAAGDAITCMTDQISGASQTIYVGDPHRSSFNAARLY
ncbi:MAG TPA: hypothetical protein VGI10_14230, partial [Polyangiaceae bacterium]